jgi:peptide/nickel transport system substrate-binding protein
MDRILVKTYPSVRSAWADMLRGEVDMLYEVGADALASLEASQNVQLFTFQRSYSYEVVLNTRKPELRSREIRRQLNGAIDRQALVTEGLGGHGRPTDSPLWPLHWAYDQRLPTFTYQPVRLEKPIAFTCLFADAALERLALATQKQLAAIGVDMKLERLPLDQFSTRFVQGDFDAILGDILSGPSMFRSYLFWHSAGAWNYGHFNSARVDLALDAIREAADDDAYRAGVAAYQQAMVDDPPAIFLAWSERARAVSTRFDVHAEPGRDILSTLRLWTPVSTRAAATAH